MYNYMNKSELLSNYKSAHLALHRLWTKDVGTDGYDKSKWKELDNAVNKLARDLADAIGYSGPLLP